MLLIENLIKVFHPGTVNEMKAINGVSLHVKKGDVISLIGSNGSGKSTLFNLISGTFPATSGRIVLDGENVTGMSEFKRARAIGRVFQDPTKGTSPTMSIEDNLIVSSKKGFRGLGFSLYRKGVREKYEQMLQSIGLEGRLKDNVSLLSGGQRQALTLLMVMQTSPKLLLLDEHTAALDPKAADRIMRMTEAIIESNALTCMMVTHNMQSAIEFGNRLVMMSGGRIILDVEGKEKKSLTVEKLVSFFKGLGGENFSDDAALLT